MRRSFLLWSFAATLLFVTVGLSEATVVIKKLGTSTSFYSPDIKTQDDLRKMLQVRKDDIAKVVSQVSWRGNVEDLWSALNKGEFSETTISTGTTFPFMAARSKGRAFAVRDVQYEGPPFEAYYVDFDSGGTGWRFYAPKICSNFWLEERVKPVEPPPPPPPPPPAAPEPPPPPPPPEPEVTPPPPPPPEPEVEEPGMFFLSALVGKERRVELEALEDIDISFADCETLLGVKGGIIPRFSENFGAEFSLGGKFVIADDDDDEDDGDDNDLDGEDESDHSLFVDAALHALFSGGFVGTGVSFWDLTDDEARTVALLVQFGFGSDRVKFIVEGRAPFEFMDDLGNNYMVWGGIRFVLN